MVARDGAQSPRRTMAVKAVGEGEKQKTGQGGKLGHTFQGAGNKSPIERDHSGNQLREGRSFCLFDHCCIHHAYSRA